MAIFKSFFEYFLISDIYIYLLLGFSIAFLKDEIILRENKTEPDEDTKNKDSNSNKKKKDAVKVAKKVFPKKTVSKKKS